MFNSHELSCGIAFRVVEGENIAQTVQLINVVPQSQDTVPKNGSAGLCHATALGLDVVTGVLVANCRSSSRVRYICVGSPVRDACELVSSWWCCLVFF